MNSGDRKRGEIQIGTVSGGWKKTVSLPFTNDFLRKKKGLWNVESIQHGHRFSISNGVLKLHYAKNDHGGSSGAAVKAIPKGLLPADKVEFGYDVFIPKNFTWKKGGKLPGLCLGRGTGCATGKEWAKDQGSVRVMWRSKSPGSGYAILYVYLPSGGGAQGSYAKQGGAYKKVVKKPGGDSGHNLWHDYKTFPLKKGSWNSISMVVRLNTPKKADGMLSLRVNGVSRTLDGIMFRTNSDVKVNMVNFVSFYGGGDSSWNSPSSSTYTSYKNVVLKVG